MGIRQILNSSKGTILAVLSLFVVAALFAGRQMMQQNGPTGPSGSSFYSTDDGASFFRDVAGKESPYQKDGKSAYRVSVWKCTVCGSEFVSHLERGLPKSETKPAPAPGSSAPGHLGDIEVKAPGSTSKWVRSSTPEGIALTAPKCPKGHTDCEPVAP